jgi:fatty acid desaturase
MGIVMSGRSDFNIPNTLNLFLLGAAGTTAVACLWLTSHATGWWTTIAAAIVFSYVNNTIFSLMHEAVHRTFHTDLHVNEICGRIAAAFFPTAFTLQRVFHEAHHTNNRSDVERFDYYAPHENRILKFAQW